MHIMHYMHTKCLQFHQIIDYFPDERTHVLSSLSCKLDRDLSRCLHLLIAWTIAWINSLKNINTIRAILRFKYLDIFTVFIFLELSTKNHNLSFPFDDNNCTLSKYKPIALRQTWILIISKNTICLSTLLNYKLNLIF